MEVSTAARDPKMLITVLCLCHGIQCSCCKKNKIHRPGSNSYDEKTNDTAHWPWFAYMGRCEACKERDTLSTASAAETIGDKTKIAP